MSKRASGILMHVTSLPSPYGIGTLGKAAFEFVDFLKQSGQAYWQILPLGPTGYGDSPYQSFSSFAGNPLLVDLDLLVEEGLLKAEDLEGVDFGTDLKNVDFEKVNAYKFPILKKAYKSFSQGLEEGEAAMGGLRAAFEAFQKDQSHWLRDYSLFMALKKQNDDRPWQMWEDPFKMRQQGSLEAFEKAFAFELGFWEFVQFLFYKQWHALKGYANKKGIKIIGDVPIYVASDSADTWARPDLFYFDAKENPLVVAGCPPDAFSEDGQLWGNPIYKWPVHKAEDFKWWMGRLKVCEDLYDVTRIDHFRGFDEYWEIPAKDDTARYGKWVAGPKKDFIDAINDQMPHLHIIAEDLGFLTPSVIELLEYSTYPGMKVLQFAFDPREESDYLPHNYPKNCVVYTGTHDNDTLLGWYETIDEATRTFAKDYLRLSQEEGIHWGFIRGAMSSVADLSVAQIQDFLGEGSDCRMNIPSTIGCNWKYRLAPGQLTQPLADKIYKVTKTYGRLDENDE